MREKLTNYDWLEAIWWNNPLSSDQKSIVNFDSINDEMHHLIPLNFYNGAETWAPAGYC